MVAHDSLHRPEVLSSGEGNSMGGVTLAISCSPTPGTSQCPTHLLPSFPGHIPDSSSPYSSFSHILSHLDVPRDIQGYR